ncbi:MAG: CvpA family protein [Candidatus Planktophila sp.]|nr:CvpA family protein [Candidatus Planktophila sp.]
MLTDLIIAIALIFSAISGYRNGFIRTVFKLIGYTAGGVMGIYFALQFSHDWALDIKRIGFVIITIIGGGFIGSFAAGVLAKGLRSTIVRGPLAFLDSVAGATLEIVRTVIILYLIATVLLWSPWNAVQAQVSESQILRKVQPYIPGLITQANDWVKEEFLNLRL